VAGLQIYEKLLQFPLFQGMSRDDLEIVAGHTRFGFLKVSAGRQVIRTGEACTHLFFLINGTLRVESFGDENRYSVVEQMSSPYILQQEGIFGYNQRYTHHFYAMTDVNFLTLDKEEVVRLSEDFLVFRLNLLNHFATQTQKLIHQQWRRSPQTLRERIVRFFFQHALYPAGPKTFYILMERLAEELNDSRLNISRTLNAMQAEGLLELHRGRIEIAQLERLLK
jgi:CRP-like cAMP-binding protein